MFSFLTILNLVPTERFRDLEIQCSDKFAKTPNLNLWPDRLVSALMGSWSFSTLAPVFWSSPMMVQRVQSESALKMFNKTCKVIYKTIKQARKKLFLENLNETG